MILKSGKDVKFLKLNGSGQIKLRVFSSDKFLKALAVVLPKPKQKT